MSRIGKLPVTIPSGVNVALAGQLITISGKLGKDSLAVAPEVAVEVADGKVVLSPRTLSKQSKALWGTSRALINNMVNGVSKGFVKNLEISGVGFRAAVDGKNLNLQLGFSHDIVFPIPPGIAIKVGEKQQQLEISGTNRQQVGQVAAVIRALRKPEPYKGKGIKYSTEKIRRKEGKKK